MPHGLPYSLSRQIQPQGGLEHGAQKKVKLTFKDLAIALTDEAGVVAYGGLKIYDFDPGLITFHGAVGTLTITKSSAGVDDDAAGDLAVGTVVASNNATLATTEQDLIPTGAFTLVAGTDTVAIQSTATEIGAVFDGTSTAIDVFLNFLVDDVDHDVTTTPANIIVNGSLTLVFTNVGDN